MNRLTSRLTIGSYQIPFVTEVEIESTWQALTDTCKITLPKNLTVEGKPIVDGNNAVFKIGDTVKVELGYDYQYDTVFKGYVADVKTKIPLELICEDEMWLFKRQSYKKTYENVTVKQLVEFLMTKISVKFPIVYSFPGLNLGKFRINLATGAQVLEELRKKYGIQSFFREGTLYVGFAYTQTGSNYKKTVPFVFNDTIIDDDLVFRNGSDFKIKVKGTALNADNKQLTANGGDGDGIEIPRFYYHKTQEELQALVNNEAKKLKISGFQGSFETFGRPFVRHSDQVELHDNEIPERSGTYLVNKVTRRFGQDGYRQSIELDRRTS